MLPRPLAIASSLALAISARANDTNYQNYLVGERALGLGGAYCALADDASGAFYNPAGVVHVPSSSLSASLSIYGIERRRYEDGYSRVLDGSPVSVDLEDSPVATLPTTVALVRKLGGRMADGVSRHAVGFATYLPYSTSFETDEVLATSGSDGSIFVSESDRTIWAGPFYAVRLTESLSAGLAVHYSYRTVKRRLSQKWEQELDDGDPKTPNPSAQFSLEEAAVDYTSGELFPRAGLRWDLSRAWSVGVAASAPTVHVRGEGRLRSETISAEVPSDVPGLAFYEPADDSGLQTRNAEPVTVRLGGAWRGERALAALDLTYHAAGSYRPIELPERQTALVSKLLVTDVEREQVLNVNLGGEYHFLGRVPVRAGALTNFSSAPEVRPGDSPQLAHVDMYGVTASVGFAPEDYEISVGALYGFGSGQASAIDRVSAAAGDHEFQPRPLRHDFIYFYVSGAQKALTRVVKKVLGTPSKK